MHPANQQKIDALGTTQLIITVLCWSAGPLFLKAIAGHIDAWTQNALRYMVACVVWLPYLVISHRRGKLPPQVWKLALPTVLANIVMQSLWAAGFYFLGAAMHNLLAKSAVIWVIIAAVIFFPEERRLFKSKFFWIGLTLACSGVIGVIAAGSNFKLEGTGKGVIIVTLATMSWAAYTVTIKKHLKDIAAPIAFGVVSIYTVIALTILMFIFGKPVDCLVMPRRIWWAVVLSAVIALALSHSLYYSTIKRIGATIPALSLLTTPFLVALAAAPLYGERLTAAEWCWGAILIIGAACTILAQGAIRPAQPEKA